MIRWTFQNQKFTWDDNKGSVKEFEGLSLRTAEVRAEMLLGVRIDHSVLHFWEKKLAYMEEIVNKILRELHKLEESFIDSTIFTNKKGKG